MNVRKLVMLVLVTLVIAILLASALNTFTRVADDALAESAPTATPPPNVLSNAPPNQKWLPIILLNAPNDLYWSVFGNGGTNPNSHFLGTTDFATLTLRVNNVVGWRLLPSGANTPNIIGGHISNTVMSGVVGAVIGGGGERSFNNRVTDNYGTVGGGENNRAGDNDEMSIDAQSATVGGGASNTASDFYTTVGGGYLNNASKYAASVGGGFYNSASGLYATVGGGHTNTANGQYATVGGGYNNAASGQFSTVGGGSTNNAGNYGVTVGGGQYNNARGPLATIGGGQSNTASGSTATIAGGVENSASGGAASVGGGVENIASGSAATVGGGTYNTSSGYVATVPGGLFNSATMSYTFASGYRAKANHQGTFVWGDSTEGDFLSTATDQFLIRAKGGVGINTNSPQATLDISGSLRVNRGGTVLNRIQAGTASVPTSKFASMVFTVTFPSAFSTTPRIIATPRGEDSDETFVVTTRRISTMYAVFNVVRADQNGGWTQNLELDWLAWE